MNESLTQPKGRRGGLFAKAAGSPDSVSEDTLRPPMREEDPRARAKQRAAELRGHLGDVVDGVDEFYISPDVVPDGWEYQWKRHTIYGQEDPAYQVSLARSGWSPVPTSRHPDMMPHDTSAAHITRKGQILMECPLEIVEERRHAEQIKAKQQVRAKEAQLSGTPDGTLTRDHARARPQIKKSYEAMPIPEK